MKDVNTPTESSPQGTTQRKKWVDSIPLKSVDEFKKTSGTNNNMNHSTLAATLKQREKYTNRTKNNQEGRPIWNGQ